MTTLTLIPQTIRPLAPFAHLAGRSVTTRPSRALRRRMRTPETLTISQWAERYRRVTEIDAKPGPWRPEMVPHARPIMDSIGLPWVRQVWICLPERGAKTQILLNTVCWGIDQGSAAGNVFWLMPTENDARKAMGERIIPVFKAKDDHGRPGRIARYISSALDDTSRGTIRFNHGIRLFPAWANSPGSMASYFGRINIADECDKFPKRTSEGTDPITLFLKRARDDRQRSKYVFASTPAGSFIYAGAASNGEGGVMNCQQINTWAMRCPSCGDYVTPGEDHLHIPDGTTTETAGNAELALACPACGTLWDEEDRAVAYHGGRNQIIKGAEIERPATVGHHSPAWVFPVIPLAEIARAKLLAATGDHGAQVAWANGYAVKDYKQETKERKENTILRLCDERHAGDVHPESDILTIQIDTQDKGFWYTIRGWQYGPQLNSWLVKAGYVPSANADDFSALDQLIYDDVYTTAAGVEQRIAYGIIDSAGHRTGEVYGWCRRTGIFASKGARGRKTQPVTVSKMEVFPGTTRQIPGGLLLYHLDTHYHKDLLNNKLQIEATDPGAFVLHSGYSRTQRALLDETPQLPLASGLLPYAKHFCAEYRDEKGFWQCSDNADNHLWDCESMGIALAYYLGFHKKRREEDQPKEEPQQKHHLASGGKPAWFNNRGGR